MKSQTVSLAALRAMAVKNTKASARLEGCEVPEGHVRSQAVEQYIAEHTSKTAGGCTSRLGPAQTPKLPRHSIPKRTVAQASCSTSSHLRSGHCWKTAHRSKAEQA